MTDADIVIVGGGIAGLTVAWETARAGRRVLVLEADEATGGMLRSGRVAGADVDLGAESFALRTSAVEDLIADAGLDLRTVAPRPQGAQIAYLDAFRRVRRAPLPRRAILGIPADPTADDVVRIVGARAAKRAARERDLPWSDAAEPDLRTLATERLGAVVAARLVDPLCRSVYSTPADAVRLSEIQPALWAEARRTGSLTAAVDALAPATRAGAAVRGIEGGMWRLAAELRAAAERAGAEVRTATAVAAVESAPAGSPTGGALVRLAGTTIHAREVVVATGPVAAARLLRHSVDVGPAVRLVTVEVTTPALDGAPVGSGVIVASGVPTAAKALTHADAKWEWMGTALPPHAHIVRLSARDADASGLSTPAEIAREIRLLTGAPVRADDIVRVAETWWPDAIAGGVDDAWGRAVADAAARGIRVTGAAVAGTGLASVIPHARTVAHEVLSSAAATPEGA